LDEALATVGEKVRSALVLRYLKGMSVREVAAALGIGEDAAKQRMSRGVEQLRSFFARRGVLLPAGAITSTIAACCAEAAPPGLAAAATAAACSGQGAAAATLAAAERFAWWTLPKAKVLAGFTSAAVVVAIVGTATFVLPGSESSKTPVPIAAAQAGAYPTRQVTLRLAGTADLRRLTGQDGAVIAPDGRPVSGADVMLATSRHPVNVHNPVSFGGLRVVTDSDGRFAFPPSAERHPVVAIHEQGFRVIGGDELHRANGVVLLQPWGRIDGVAKVGTASAAGAMIHYSRPSDASDPGHGVVAYNSAVLADAGGRFTLPRVAPGGAHLVRFVGHPDSVPSHATPVRVEPGQAVRVQLGGSGRAVVGRLELPPGPATRDAEATSERATRIVALRPLRDDGPKGQLIQYCGTADPDGTFRVDDVPGGRYLVVVWEIRSGLLRGGAGGGNTATTKVSVPSQPPLTRPLIWPELTVPEPTRDAAEVPFDVGVLRPRGA
jgi:hypothetical protein